MAADPEAKPPIELAEAGLIYADAVRILAAMSDAHRTDSRAIPREVATWGDLRLLIPSLVALLSFLHPQLKDEETLDAILRDFLTSTASGRPN